MGHPLSLEDRIASLNWAPIPVSRILAAFAVAALALAGALGFFNADSGFAGDAPFVVPAVAFALLTAIFLRRRDIHRLRIARIQAERFSILTETMGDVVVTHDRSGAATSVSGNCEALSACRRGV